MSSDPTGVGNLPDEGPPPKLNWREVILILIFLAGIGVLLAVIGGK